MFCWSCIWEEENEEKKSAERMGAFGVMPDVQWASQPPSTTMPLPLTDQYSFRADEHTTELA